MIILFEQGASVAVVSISGDARLPEVSHQDGENVVVDRALEADASFALRMVADHVPDGARWRVVDAAALPDVPPERWSVDWVTGAITVLTVPVVVPEEVGLWAAQAVLARHGLYDAVEAYALAQKATNPVVYFAWTMGNTVSRHGAFVTALAPQFGLSDVLIDALFVEAAAIAF